MTANMDINLVLSRNVGIQKNRDNHEGSPKAYFRRSMFLLLLDQFSIQLKMSFFEHRELRSKIQNI